ncbi:UPF0545 protein C22orf39 homolog [Ixodes scapularis]|uniref:UPF0545 protein C22orf39 homolog n=1 Tax=Ixodes scapularis TaxID=6945 RepID=UPI001A9E1ECD|nr:UPF0545 protein C22orf39 homolog [Ixodes scapularis]
MATSSRNLRTEVTEVASSDAGPTKAEIPENAWMVRPCEWYLEEYKDCKSIRARFHQYFVFGSTIDCEDWSKDYGNCLKFRAEKDVDALRSVVESEEKRKKERLDASLRNDVWDLRSEPPKDWNGPLPDWMEQRLSNSYLGAKGSGEAGALAKSTCCIS